MDSDAITNLKYYRDALKALRDIQRNYYELNCSLSNFLRVSKNAPYDDITLLAYFEDISSRKNSISSEIEKAFNNLILYCQTEEKRYEIIAEKDSVNQFSKHYNLNLEDNKYNLVPEDINNLKVVDWNRLKDYTWLNTAISPSCWCHTEVSEDEMDEFWIGFYSPSKIAYHFSSYEGMCGYEFEEFYSNESIECKYDLEIQSKCLKYLNTLLDNKIVSLNRS